MTQARITVGGILAGVLAAGVLAVVLALALGPAAASPAGASLQVPAPAATAAAATPVETLAGTPDTRAGDAQHYADLLVQNFATRLGTDTARVNAAFSAAAADTIDQAVHDGKLDPATAAKAKAVAAQGLGVLIQASLVGASKAGNETVPADAAIQASLKAVFPALAPLFGLTESTLLDALKQGQSLQSLEQAHHVTDQQVKDAALGAVRTTLSQGVAQRQWSQADADSAYQTISANLDNFLRKLLGAAGDQSAAGKNDAYAGPQQAAFEAANQAVAGLFGLQADALDTALRDGQVTLLGLEQAHGVSEQKVHDTAVAAAQQALAAGVQAGHWTQADAGVVAQDFAQHAYDYLAKIRNVVAMPALVGAIQAGVAPLFGLSTDQLVAALQSGQALPALEQAHNVAPARVHAAALAAAQARLAQGVQNKEWTQAQADDAAVVLNETLDELLTGNLGAGLKTGRP